MEVTAFQEKKGKSIQSELELGILKFSSGTFSKAFAKKSPSYSSPVLPLKDIPLGQLLLLSSVQASSPCIQGRVYQQEKELVSSFSSEELKNTSDPICD